MYLLFTLLALYLATNPALTDFFIIISDQRSSSYNCLIYNYLRNRSLNYCDANPAAINGDLSIASNVRVYDLLRCPSDAISGYHNFWLAARAILPLCSFYVCSNRHQQQWVIYAVGNSVLAFKIMPKKIKSQ
jgi:hypothetical protein